MVNHTRCKTRRSRLLYSALVKLHRSLALAITIGIVGAAFAPSQAPASQTSEIETPLAPLDTSSPRATLDALLGQQERLAKSLTAYRHDKTLAASHRLSQLFAPARRLFDLSDVPPAKRWEVGGASVGYLLDIVNRLPPQVDDALPSETGPDAASTPERIRLPGTEIELVRMAEGPRRGEYLFSAETVRRLPEFYERIMDEPLQRETRVPNWRMEQVLVSGPLFPYDVVRRLPGPLQAYVLGTPAWKVLLTLVLAAMLLWVTGRWWRLSSRMRRDRSAVADYLLRLSVPLLAGLLIIAFKWFAHVQINPSGAFAEGADALVVLGMYIAAAWAVWNLFHLAVEWIISSPRIPDQGYDAHLLRLLARVAGIIGVGALIVYGLNAIGLPVLGLIAGVGIGGVALALAAQSTVENLFGGVNVFADRPFRVGDLILYGSNVGTVERVGPRSTRIRGFDGALTTVPNGDLAKMHITNYATRKKCLFRHILTLRYETTTEQIKWLLRELCSRLAAHPMIEEVPGMPRVRLIGFGSSSLDIEARAYVLTGDYGEFLVIQEELLLMIMRLVDEAGTGFAFPSQTTYLTRDKAPDSGRLLSHRTKDRTPETPASHDVSAQDASPVEDADTAESR